MIPFIFIVVITAVSVFLFSRLSSGGTWMVYYWGALIGIFASGVIIKLWNYKRLKDEEKKQ